MNKSVDELHNQVNAASLRDSLSFFFGLILLLVLLGVLIWSVF
jgi:hypothetical protein